MRYIILSLMFLVGFFSVGFTQSPSWRLWADGLPTGVYPRMVVAPNHDIFYSLLGAGTNLGLVFKANTQDALGQFTALPKIPRPSTIQNNIVALGYNKKSEAIVGIYRSDNTQPWLFKYNKLTDQWDTATSTVTPSLGGHCIATSENGTIYVGTRWAYIYKSTDDGNTYEVLYDSKSVKSAHPCYYPSALNNSDSNGAIFSIAIDRNGRIYAGTETAGVIFSDDEGRSWHPADIFACQTNDPNQKDTTSLYYPLSISGNVAALGFTKDNALIWSGVNMWALNWKNKMGFADYKSQTVAEIKGLPDYLIQTGQQVSKLVTTTNGQIFFHSGSSTGASQIGIYTSFDGIHWTSFNNGITGQNDGTSQGSLAVDGNKVFMATRDGKVWIYEDSLVSNSDQFLLKNKSKIKLSPNPVKNLLQIELDPSIQNDVLAFILYDAMGKKIISNQLNSLQKLELDVSEFASGLYYIKWVARNQTFLNSCFIKN